MLAVTRGTQALLDLEDDGPELLFEHVPGSPVPFWPSVRMHFSVALTQLDLEYPPMVAGPAATNPLSLLATAFVPSGWDAGRIRGARDVAYVVGGGTTYAADNGQRNWLVGDFADVYPERSAILQWLPLPSRTGSPVFRPTHTLDRLVTRAAAYAKLRPLSDDAGAAIRRLVQEFARRIDTRFSEERVATITAAALYAERLRPGVERSFARVLDRLKPRIVLMEDGSYGSWGSIIALMKSRGILVAEPQHGWIGPSHAAYNFGAAMTSPQLSATLPDELLTFGDYWAEGLRFPGLVTPIGKPHLETQSAAATPPADRSREVLWVSSTTTPDQVSDLILALRDALGIGWVVRFRPHPVERPTLGELYPKLVDAPGVVIDQRGDVAASLADSRAVVGVASTVLFEALAFGVPVFPLRSASAPFYVGDVFGPLIEGPAGIERIARTVLDAAAGNPQSWAPAVQVERVWKPESVSNFRAWASSRLPA